MKSAQWLWFVKHLKFDSDEDLNGFATIILQSKWPGQKLHHGAQIETEMNFNGGDEEAKAILKRLLQQTVDAACLQRGQYRTEFRPARSEMLPSRRAIPPRQVWSLIAIPTN
jgi:hypothetical protein